MSRPAPDGALDAFTTAVSGLPGQPLEVKVSTMAPSYRIEVYRLGAYDGGSSRLVHGPERVAGRVQPAAVLPPGVDPDRRRAVGRRRCASTRPAGSPASTS